MAPAYRVVGPEKSPAAFGGSGWAARLGCPKGRGGLGLKGTGGFRLVVLVGLITCKDRRRAGYYIFDFWVSLSLRGCAVKTTKGTQPNSPKPPLRDWGTYRCGVTLRHSKLKPPGSAGSVGSAY